MLIGNDYTTLQKKMCLRIKGSGKSSDIYRVSGQ